MKRYGHLVESKLCAALISAFLKFSPLRYCTIRLLSVVYQWDHVVIYNIHCIYNSKYAESTINAMTILQTPTVLPKKRACGRANSTSLCAQYNSELY